MVQSVIQWGKNPVVVIKQQDDHVKSVKKSKPQNAKDGSTKRKSRQDAKDDRLLIKKLKEDDAMAVRSDDVDIDSEELVIGKPVMTRSGRQVRVWTRFDV